jgi:cytochrome b561
MPPEDQRFDSVAISFHWISLALVTAQFSSAWLIAAATRDQAALLLVFHRSLGIVIWFVTACRFAWRTRFARLPPFPNSMPKFQQVLAVVFDWRARARSAVSPVCPRRRCPPADAAAAGRGEKR